MLKGQAKPIHTKNDIVSLNNYISISTASFIAIFIIINNCTSSYPCMPLDVIRNIGTLHLPLIILPTAMASSFRFRSTPLYSQHGTNSSSNVGRKLFTNISINSKSRDRLSHQRILENRFFSLSIANNDQNASNKHHQNNRRYCYSFISNSNHHGNSLRDFTNKNIGFLPLSPVSSPSSNTSRDEQRRPLRATKSENPRLSAREHRRHCPLKMVVKEEDKKFAFIDKLKINFQKYDSRCKGYSPT